MNMNQVSGGTDGMLSQSIADKIISDLKVQIQNACQPLDIHLQELENEVKSIQQYTNQMLEHMDAQLKQVQSINTSDVSSGN
jgi:hypothetical protein